MDNVDDMRGPNDLLEVTNTGEGLRLHGEIDASSARLLSGCLDPLPGTTGDLELHMAGVSFVDSSGLRVLIAAHQRAAAVGRTLVLVDPSPVVQRLLDISGLEDLLAVRTSS